MDGWMKLEMGHKCCEHFPAFQCGAGLGATCFMAEPEEDRKGALLHEQFICSPQSFSFTPWRQVLIVRRDIFTLPHLLLLWLFSFPSSLPPAIRNWIWSRTIHLVPLLQLLSLSHRFHTSSVGFAHQSPGLICLFLPEGMKGRDEVMLFLSIKWAVVHGALWCSAWGVSPTIWTLKGRTAMNSAGSQPTHLIRLVNVFFLKARCFRTDEIIWMNSILPDLIVICSIMSNFWVKACRYKCVMIALPSGCTHKVTS